MFKRQKSRCLFLSFNFFAWISVALAFLSYFWGAESVKNELTNNDPCSAPIKDCYDGIKNKFKDNEENLKKFEDWFDNLDKDDICANVLVPMLILEIIMLIFYLVFTSFISGCCYCKPLGEVENDDESVSENENDKNVSQNSNMIPNQNNLNVYPSQYPNQNAQPNENIQNAQSNETEQNANPIQTIQNLEIKEP